jgi:hypothetical protein
MSRSPVPPNEMSTTQTRIIVTRNSDYYTDILRETGDVFYLQVPNRRIVVLNRLEDAEHLLVDKANIWSGRPLNLMIDELYAHLS